MEKRKQTLSVFCSLHPSDQIVRVSSDRKASQKLYCSECMLECEDLKSLATTLQTVDRLISSAALFYSNTRSTVCSESEPPSEYADIISRQGENLDQLTKHINQEKKKIEDLFSELTNTVLDRINLEKNKYLQKLDDQVSSLCNQYAFFERQIKKTYPKLEDLASLYPSKDELESSLSKITNSAQLVAFVDGITADMDSEVQQVDEGSDTEKEAFLAGLLRNLKRCESAKPSFKISNLNLHELEQTMIQELNRFLDKTLRFVDIISQEELPESCIVKDNDFDLLRSWLPEKYQWRPKLLYRGSRDGMNAKSFHEKCDNKGPTITILKSRFNGTDKDSIIGGFLDKEWNCSDSYASSEEAFVFSLSEKVKCKLLKSQNAARFSGAYGPCFGGEKSCFELYLTNNFDNCSCYPGGYENSKSLIPCKYDGQGCNFKLLEIEVYTLSRKDAK